MVNVHETHTYTRAESIVFCKTNEPFGGLSNMAAGFKLRINNVQILTTEALYQACRFPHDPTVQKKIIDQASPMAAKMVSKPHRHGTRTDWDTSRVSIMAWCLRLKLAFHWSLFGGLLLSTGDKPIVEESKKDAFWGAKTVGEHTLFGANVLGRLLMELREKLRHDDPSLLQVMPPSIPDFMLLGFPIGAINATKRPIVQKSEPLTLLSFT